MAEDFQLLVQRQHWALEQEFKQLEERAAALRAKQREELEAFAQAQRAAAAKASGRVAAGTGIGAGTGLATAGLVHVLELGPGPLPLAIFATAAAVFLATGLAWALTASETRPYSLSGLRQPQRSLPRRR